MNPGYYLKTETIVIKNRTFPEKFRKLALTKPPSKIRDFILAENALVAEFTLPEEDLENPWPDDSAVLDSPSPGVCIKEVDINTGAVRESIELDRKEACALAKAILARFEPK